MKSNLSKVKALSLFLAAVLLMTSLFVVISLPAGAAGGENSEGASFTSKNMYTMLKSIPSHSSFTFESEFYISPTFADKSRAYNIIGNWATSSSNRDKNEWGVELHQYGSVRLFHTNYGSVYFNTNTDEYDSAGNLYVPSTTAASSYNDGEKSDVRTWMGTESEPKYVRMTITVDTSTGTGCLYLNGELVCKVENNSVIKGRTYAVSSKNPYHIVGGDYRDANAGAFQGKIKNIAMYDDIRTEAEILAYANSASFAVDSTDANLLFAYDLTSAKNGFFKDLSANNNNASDINWTTTEGRAFSASDKLFAEGEFTEMPRTYEAWIYPTPSYNRNGVIFGNYGSGSNVLLNFEIHSSGRPSVYLRDDSGNLMDTKFDYNINRSTWVHLVITHETLSEGGARFTLYIDGEKQSSFDTALSYEFDPANLTLMQLGGDSRSGNAQSYKGRIKNVALYSDVLTDAQILASYRDGVDKDAKSLILNYELDGTDGATQIKDSGKNGYDLHPLFYENQSPAADYEYSFAIVGDTQKLVYYDAYNNTNYTDYIYDWIVQNAESKNIKFVMGMGDITDKNGVDQTTAEKGNDDGIDQSGIEWDIAVAQHKKLYDAGIPYGIIQGNHDTVAKLDEYFEDDKNFTEADIGYYSGTSLGNYYMRFTVGETKYMMVGLQYGPSDDILKWAGEVIAANPEHRVIITTHSYMFRDGTTLDINDVVPPRAATATNGKNNGDQIWTKLASQYKNVIMVFSGHDPYANIAWRQDLGINGNTVTQFLIDFQSMDQSYNYKTGMVAMLYFSKDGKTVQVEYISTYNTLEAQKTDSSAKDVLYDSLKNQFTFTIPDAVALSSVECEYGTIPGVYSNEITYPFVVFKKDKTFVGGYGDLGAATAAAKAAGEADDYIVLMRRDAEQNSKSNGLASMTGSITIDLGGNTLYKTAVGYIFDIYVNNNSSATLKNGIDVRGTYVLKNGTVVKYGTLPLVCVNYGAELANSFSVAFEFDGVEFIDQGGTNHIIATWENGYAASSIPVYADAVFTDCTFNYSKSVADTNMICMTQASGYDRVVWDVTLTGGKIVADAAVAFDEFVSADGNANGRADKVTFIAGADGAYVSQVLPKSASAPSVLDTWVIGGKDMFFAPESSDSVYAVYTLIDGDIEDYGDITEYGYVSNENIDPENYPILLFKNGEYVGKHALFANGTNNVGALAAAKTLTDGSADGEIGSTVQLLFIGDAEATGVFTNFGQILGTVVVDLNGHTLTQNYTSNALFASQAKYWKGMDAATFEVFGGNIVLKTQLLTFNAYGESYQNGDGTDAYKNFNMNFEDVNFSYAEASEAGEFLGIFSDSSGVFGKSVGYNVNFTDCVFDLTEADSMSLLMNANDNNTVSVDGSLAVNCIVKVSVAGGSIITHNQTLDFYESSDNGSSVSFCKNEEGEYTDLKLLAYDGECSLENSVLTDDGKTYIFFKIAECDGYVNYSLRDEVFSYAKVKTSVSLWSDFIYNVYILKSDALKAVGMDSATLDMNNLNVVNIDGAQYYSVSVALPASEALRDITLCLTLNDGNGDNEASFTTGMMGYTKKIIYGDYSDAEKALAKDMLSYTRAAYAYFGKADEAKITEIDALLGENYDSQNAPDMSEVAKTPSGNYGFDKATIALDATPSFRFYLSEGFEASDFSFTVAGLAAEAKSGSDLFGDYVEVKVCANNICNDITYTVTIDGVEYTESYNIYSYYEYACEEYSAKAALIALVERLVAYSNSAEIYKNYVAIQ